MTVPMKRGTSSRQGRRRRNIFLATPALSKCIGCGKLKRPHIICRHCGSK